MNRDEVLEKTLGNRMVILAREIRCAVGGKHEIPSRMVDSLREMFRPLRRSCKSTEDQSP